MPVTNQQTASDNYIPTSGMVNDMNNRLNNKMDNDYSDNACVASVSVANIDDIYIYPSTNSGGYKDLCVRYKDLTGSYQYFDFREIKNKVDSSVSLTVQSGSFTVSNHNGSDLHQDTMYYVKYGQLVILYISWYHSYTWTAGLCGTLPFPPASYTGAPVVPMNTANYSTACMYVTPDYPTSIGFTGCDLGYNTAFYSQLCYITTTS